MLCEDADGNKFLVKLIENCKDCNFEEVHVHYFFTVRNVVRVTSKFHYHSIAMLTCKCTKYMMLHVCTWDMKCQLFYIVTAFD